ncbi:MAG: hypothetical protein ACP5N7_02395 [Candidatus Pacearchaeota archaeon]
MKNSNNISLDDIQTGIIKHESLPEDLVVRIHNFKQKLGDVEPSSVEETIENFKEDTNPEKEILMWEAMAEVYEIITKNKDYPYNKRREIFKMLLIASSKEISNSDIENPELIDLKEAQIIEAYLVHALTQKLGKERNPITVRRVE